MFDSKSHPLPVGQVKERERGRAGGGAGEGEIRNIL